MSCAYLHFPFCLKKCRYCNFVSYPVAAYDLGAYLDTLRLEILNCAADFPPLTTVYLGGGTPSLAPAPQLRSVMQALEQRFSFAAQPEITLEANPRTVTRSQLNNLRAMGFNRISLGLQSLEDANLKFLGRAHDAAQGIAAVKAARAAGFDNLSLDLIYALPGQTLAAWQRDLDRALALEPDHISAYELTLEPRTPLFRQVQTGRCTPCAEAEALAMMEYTATALPARGYQWYEISNYALPGKACRHNLNYWNNLPYLGFGAGAAGFWQGWRRLNHPRPKIYRRKILSGGTALVSAERLSQERLAGETVMLGLRLRQGIALEELRARFGAQTLDRVRQQAAPLKQRGWLEITRGRLRLTAAGVKFANSVCAEFLS